LMQLLKQNRLYVLADDIAVRGINADELVNGIEVIDYSEMVGLTVKNPVIQSWT
jgi:tRNA 2-thiouridine synthesizing protein B